MIAIGIDPGNKGAITILDGDSEPIIYDMPIIEETVKIKQSRKTKIVTITSVDIRTIQKILMGFIFEYLTTGNLKIGLEKVQNMGQAESAGTRQLDQFLKNYGELRGLIKSFDMPFEEIPPVRWQNFLRKPDTKEGSMELAHQLYPNANLWGPRGGMKDGRADSLLIAHYIKVKHQQQKIGDFQENASNGKTTRRGARKATSLRGTTD